MTYSAVVTDDKQHFTCMLLLGKCNNSIHAYYSVINSNKMPKFQTAVVYTSQNTKMYPHFSD